MKKLSGKSASWLSEKRLQHVFDALEGAGGEARINGGAVRNSLMGQAVGDVDISTTLLPDETAAALENTGIRAVPTGIEHGTITAVSDGKSFEITTLREDIETDGRHAVVRFGKNWIMDAQRRDLTINALYCDRDGTIYDPLNGYADIETRTVRFIGEAEERIEEDYLRILRFFRFFAWYGSGRPDAKGLKACAKLKSGLETISAERLWSEMKKMLSASDPARALLWMRTTSVLSTVLPETEKWGIDLVPSLIEAEQNQGWQADPMLRLMAMIAPREEIVTGLSSRLKLSGQETKRLWNWAKTAKVAPDTEKAGLEKRLYADDRQAILDVLKLDIAVLTGKGPDKLEELNLQAGNYDFARNWERPVFPVKGEDLTGSGFRPGPKLGDTLKKLEKQWIESRFKLTKAQLLEQVQSPSTHT